MLGQTALLVSILLLIAHSSEGRTREHEVPDSATRQKRQAEVQTVRLGCYKLFETPPKKGAAFKKVYHSKRYKTAAFLAAAPQTLIDICAENAYKDKFDLMGVTVKSKGKSTILQCRTAPKKREERYKMHGQSSECKNGIGGTDSMSVYRVSEKNPGINPGGNCNFNGKTYSPGEEMKIPNEYGNKVADAKCQHCECQGGRAESCKTDYFCETGPLVTCEKTSVASGDCCPTCECFHQNKLVRPEEKWVIVKKDHPGHKCFVFKCGDAGRATVEFRRVWCDCSEFHKKSENEKAKDLCCKTICEKSKPKTTQRPILVTTQDKKPPPFTFPPFF